MPGRPLWQDHDPSPAMADASTTSRNNSKVLSCQVKL
ncbi:hypothetical protein M0804_003017 [Polistes exclamans]|nr:hypothetical protein M0804_003017 [Polistes exclamans]